MFPASPAPQHTGDGITPQTLFDLTGKTALVTGGATGIGRMASEEGVTALAAGVSRPYRSCTRCGHPFRGNRRARFPDPLAVAGDGI